MGDIFESGPVYMRSLIGMTVSVRTVNSVLHEGAVFAIDPDHETVVLANETDKSLTFILRHSIESFVVSSDTPKVDFVPKNCITTSTNVEDKKEAVKKWLNQRFIPVEDCERGLKIDSHVVIESPYTSEDCFSDNTIVLEKVRNIIKQMPDDFK